MKHLWKGQLINDSELAAKILNLEAEVVGPLEHEFDLSLLLDTFEKFSKMLTTSKKLNDSLKEDGFSDIECSEILKSIATFCARKNLETKILKELGSLDIFDPIRNQYDSNNMESWRPLGVLAHITPGNSPALSFLALVEGLLAGNINILKLSSSDGMFTLHAAQVLAELDSSGFIAGASNILKISSKEGLSIEKIIRYSDGVSVWGGDGALEAIQSKVPAQTRFIPWGHKISFSYISFDNKNDIGQLQALANDCVALEQQACSSVQVVFLETNCFKELCDFGSVLGRFIDKASRELPVAKIELQEQAEITNKVEVCRLEEVLGKAKLIEGDNKSWRILIEDKSSLDISPLFRTILLRPLEEKNILRNLLPWRNYLQTVSLITSKNRLEKLAKIFFRSGVTRITPAGKMLEGYTGEPHDGVYALSRFLKRVRIDNQFLQSHYRLSELGDFKLKEHTGKIMTKVDFLEQENQLDKGNLFFKSGGSSGKTVLSPFTYRDYHSQMQAAAEGLYGAGIDPASDRIINLFFGGSLYGGFLSFYTILEKLKCTQFPMGAVDNWEMVGDCIVENKINTIVGMPSYIIQVVTHNLEKLQKYNGLRKIFFGGEHFHSKQRQWLEKELGIKVIRSASYGSVDAGPIGFQCTYCEGSEHHLNHTLHDLEILDLESDKNVLSGEVGRLVVTTKNREAIAINRYDIGDLGRWVTASCKCGRTSPKFELLGRAGDILRAAGTFLNYQKIVTILAEKLNYSGEVQVSITNSNNLDQLNIFLDEDFFDNSVNYEVQLQKNYHALKESIVVEKLLKLTITPVKREEFIRTRNSGKLKRVIDKRL